MDEPIDRFIFKRLTPKVRCAALVGYFLQCWSALESLLNEAIEKALQLTATQGAIVTKNIQLRDKLNILKTLVDMRGEQVKRFKDALEAVGAMSYQRNMVAHDMFLAEDQGGDGVRFLVVKAKGKLTFPETRWSVDDFFAKYEEIKALASEISTMTAVISTLTLGTLLQKGSSDRLLGRGYLVDPLPPLPADPDSHPPASPEKAHETPPEPDQK